MVHYLNYRVNMVNTISSHFFINMLIISYLIIKRVKLCKPCNYAIA